MDNEITIHAMCPSEAEENREAFAQVVQQYSEPLYWKIRRMVLSHDDANDVLQNVFLKAWTNMGEFKNKSRMSTWLYRIAVNETLDFLRKKKRMDSFCGSDDASVANQLLADEYFDGDETQVQLQEAIAQLPEVQRMVFNLRYFDEMKYSEMSRLLDTSEGALKASYHLAVKKITEFFKQYN
jgi:RNA polymerase sigma-70 factor (ECF subfamily)